MTDREYYLEQAEMELEQEGNYTEADVSSLADSMQIEDDNCVDDDDEDWDWREQ